MLKKQNIPFQLYETELTHGIPSAWKYGAELDLDDHSALIAVGGDGTLHEVINGMMFR